MQNWSGKKVTVIGGLGIEGMDLVRYCSPALPSL
jgi:hypothetical protein